jgi:hypothetical protein
VFAVVRAARRLLALAACVWAAGCKTKASASQCDELLDRYAQLVVTQQFPDAAVEQIASEREREKLEARGDDAFKNCSSEVSRAEFDCAMLAPTPDSFEKCLQ